MGAVLAKFKREKTTAEVLEGIEERIDEIEKYSLNTQEQKKRFVGNFLATSIGVYVIAFIIFYFVYFPPTWRERVVYSVPLLLFPLVIILLRRVFTWYFQRKLNKNSNKLSALRAEKKKILEQVMDKETYKVAVNLLERFGERNHGRKSFFAMTPRITANTTPRVSMSQSAHALTTSGNTSKSGSQISVAPALNQAMKSPTPQLTIRSPRPGNSVQALVPRASATLVSTQARDGQELRRRTPFPVLNQQNKGVLERIVDVLIGDGPQDRFAMICKECFAHNGMALREDFEYMTFRCAFCNALNPSRKSRPIAPRLPELQHSEFLNNGSAGSSESSPSPSSEDESSTDTKNPAEQRRQRLLDARHHVQRKILPTVGTSEVSETNDVNEESLMEAKDKTTEEEEKHAMHKLKEEFENLMRLPQDTQKTEEGHDHDKVE